MKKKIAFCIPICTLLFCVVILFGLKLTAYADKSDKTLRVAYYPLEGFFEYDESGNEVGYGVELLDKISQYSGIQFNYIKADSWESTKAMLLDGEADVRMPGTMPSKPSTTLKYSKTSVVDTYDVMLTMKSREDLFYQDNEKFHTLKIAVSEGFYQVENVKEYLDEIGITEDQLVFCDEYNECRKKLENGEVDAVISNIMDMEDDMKMIARFNSISNYISMPIDSSYIDIIDDALTQIKLDEPLFLSNLYEKWFPERTTVPFTLEESEYLNSIDTLTFAFQPNEGYLSHYENGQYYGIYVEMAKAICKKLGVGFHAVSILDCQEGKETTDVYAGFFYDRNYAEQWNFALSTPLNDINYYIIQKKETEFDHATCTIAAIKKFRYTSDYLQKQYTKANFLYCDTYEDCLKAVADGKADMTVINNYIAEYYLGMYQFNDLSAKLSTEYSHLFCFATENNNEQLASILTKGVSEITDEEMNKIYIVGQEDKPESNYMQAMLYQNPLEFTFIIAGVMALIVIIAMLTFFARKSKIQNLELERALSAKSSFLARMSHDMRTPMNGILGLSYLMEEQNDITSIKAYIPQLRESGKYLLQLINDVLDVNKIESGKLTLNPTVCDEEQVFCSVIEMIQPLMNEKNIEFHFEKINIEWKYMLLDEQRVKQIFINLLSNAIKFTPNKGKIEFVMEMVSQSETMIRDKFIIRDNGIGMSKEFLPHIFEPFHQEERINTDNYNGSGLGTSIVKQLVELMGGSISIESIENVGTEVTLYLNFPLAEKPKQVEEKVEKKSVLPKGLHILMCEDHPLNAQIAMKLLENQTAEVTWAENGKIGVELFEKSEEGYFNAILMDIRMPIMNGLEATRAIRQLEREDAQTIPIIAMTANAYDSDIEESIKVGMNKHLAKPIEPEVLFEAIAELLNND